MITNPYSVIEQLVMFGIIIFPLMALLGLISIKISVNGLVKIKFWAGDDCNGG